MKWHFRGTPYYLSKQGERLGITSVLIDRARNNQEIYRVSVLLSQLCDQYHKRPKAEDGTSIMTPSELSQVRGTIHQIEQEVAKLHALAAAAAEMADGARGAFGIEASERTYFVVSGNEFEADQAIASEADRSRSLPQPSLAHDQ